MRKFWISLFDNLFLTEARPQQLTFEQLSNLLVQPGEAYRVWDKRKLPQWSPATFQPPRRKKAHAQGASCLVLDYDDGTTIDQALQAWGQWALILHTSWSHRPEHHKFRAVLPLDQDLRKEEYPAAWRWAEEHCGRTIDRHCKDISRAWVLPACDLEDPAHQRYFESRVVRAPLLRVDDIMKWAPEDNVVPIRPALRLHPVSVPGDLHQLHLDPDARAELGHALGGVVSDDAVRLVECPRCRRDAVWWWLDPTRQLNAYCNHRKSCGWKGPVAALLVNDSDFSSLEG
jgi:hypothetical protein